MNEGQGLRTQSDHVDMPLVIWARRYNSAAGVLACRDAPPDDGVDATRYIRADAIGKHLASLTREQIGKHGIRVQHTPGVGRDEVLHQDLPEEWDLQP